MRPGDTVVTGGLGADVVMEAVGTPGTFELCATLPRPGGRIVNIGVHGKPATLHLEDLWIRDITITTGLVDTNTTPVLLRMLESGQLDVGHMVTHPSRSTTSPRPTRSSPTRRAPAANPPVGFAGAGPAPPLVTRRPARPFRSVPPGSR